MLGTTTTTTSTKESALRGWLMFITTAVATNTLHLFPYSVFFLPIWTHRNKIPLWRCCTFLHRGVQCFILYYCTHARTLLDDFIARESPKNVNTSFCCKCFKPMREWLKKRTRKKTEPMEKCNFENVFYREEKSNIKRTLQNTLFTRSQLFDVLLHRFHTSPHTFHFRMNKCLGSLNSSKQMNIEGEH